MRIDGLRGDRTGRIGLTREPTCPTVTTFTPFWNRHGSGAWASSAASTGARTARAAPTASSCAACTTYTERSRVQPGPVLAGANAVRLQSLPFVRAGLHQGLAGHLAQLRNTWAWATSTGSRTSWLTTWNQADAGKIPVSGAGYRGRFHGPGFDSIWTDMSEIVRPTRDGIHGREYISTSVDIGPKPHAPEVHRRTESWLTPPAT